MIKNKCKIIISLALFVLSFFPAFSKTKINVNANTPVGNASLVCDYDNSTRTDEYGIYATISNGNTAYVYILIEDERKQGVTVYYHTVSGSAVAGVDYTDVSNGSVYSKPDGSNTRMVRIAITTNTTNMAISMFKDKSYVTRGFFVVIDRAVYDNGEELTLNNSSINKNNQTFTTSNYCPVLLYANTTVEAHYEGDDLFTFVAYNQSANETFYKNNCDYDDGLYVSAFHDSNSYIDQVKKLGLADYYVTGNCYLSEEQDSDEETTRFIIGNEGWSKWGGASCATSGTGWFFGVEINAYRTSYAESGIVALVEKNNMRNYYMSSGQVDNGVQYVKYNDTYYFRNSSSSVAGASVYRHYACDGKIDVRVDLIERCFDLAAPYVTDIFLDTSSLYASKGIYRLAVRFSEPVQNAANTKVMGETNTNTYLEFNYAGGEGSDTIYYDCDTSKYENLKINRITFNNGIGNFNETSGLHTFLGYSNIQDFSFKPTTINHNAVTFNVSLDKRIPKIDVDQVNQSSDNPKNSPIVPVTLENFTSGTVYYEWIKASEYENYLDGNELNSFAVLNKLKANALNSNYSLAGYHKLTNNSQDSSFKTQLTFDDNKQNGEFKLICYVEPLFPVSDERNIKLYVYGNYLVDNTKPTITNYSEIVNKLDGAGGFNRKYNFHVDDINGIECVNAYIKEANKTNAKLVQYTIYPDDAGNVNYTLDLQSLIDKEYTDSEGKITVNSKYGFYDLNFEVVDKAGNVEKVFNDYQTYYLSIQPFFEADLDFVATEVSETLGENIYKVNSLLRAKANDVDMQTQIITVSINNSDYEYNTTKDEYIITSVEDNNLYHLDIKFLKPGFYTLKFEVAGAYSDSFSLYVTNDYQENTINYQQTYSSELVLVNKVFQISENVQYIFINEDNQIEREYYGGTSLPTFSSETACLKFLQYYEYQDLKYEVLTSNTASFLTTGRGEGYNKAVGESVTPAQGQVWIRYKRSSWEVNTESINDWAYYYYAASDDGTNTINIDLLSENLKNTIDSICKKICSTNGKNPNASVIYLVDDEHLDSKTRAPYLNATQIALSRASRLTETKTGSNLINASYTGDPNLFENTVSREINGKQVNVPIATNLKLNVSDETRIFISAYSDSPVFKELNIKPGNTLKEAINNNSATSNITCASNIYIIRELDRNGGREFYVYIDADAPVLGLKINDEESSQYINSKGVVNIFAGKLVLTSIGDQYEDETLIYHEIDKSAYVALFTMPSKTLYGIYFNGEIPEENIAEGTYLVHVGDRSGNFYSFLAYVSNGKPVVNFKKGDTKITISIENRDEAELKSLEIYCNDVLLSSKLQKEQTFTQNGTYRVVIEDKYSDEVYTEQEEFTRAPLVVDFYYDERDENFFTKYREGNNDFMMISEIENGKLVSTSRKLKVTLVSEGCDFAISGLLASDYTYDEEKHEIIFKKLAPFYLDVWSVIQTEDIVSYKIVVDDYAPTIKVSTDNRMLNFDENDANKYSVENPNNPSSIKYSVSNDVIEEELYSGEVTSNDYVKVLINDDTAIKEVRWYQNDILVKTYTEDEIKNKELSFHIGNKEGATKIVTSDLFNNTTSFNFTFAKKKISDAKVDNLSINPSLNEVNYGHDDALIEVEANSIVHLMYQHDSETVNQIYKYENKSLYLGKYTSPSSKYGVVDYYNGGMVIGYDNDGNKQLGDKPVELIDNIYKPFADLDLSIICDPNTNKLMIKLLASEKAQKIIARINNGTTLAEYYEIELSKELGKLDFSSTTGDVNVSNDYVYSNTNDIEINYDENKIKSIEVAFNSISNNFASDSYIYTIDNMFDNLEGYYCLKVTNIYNNVTYYHLIYSSTINASIELTYQDKDNEIYSLNYADDFYANSKAIIKGYKLTKLEGKTIDDDSTIYSIISGEEYSLTINKSSTVTLEDVYGNVRIIHVYIDSDKDFKFDNSWISGYSSLANSAEGYTKSLLTIALSRDDLNTLGIEQIKIKCGEELKTLYGYDGLTFITYDSNNFNDAIGVNGTNTYKVLFANKYGDVVSKTINYSEISSLLIERHTSASIFAESISVDDAINDGVWSNREIILSSSLSDPKYYKFYVKADADESYHEVSLPYNIQLASTSQNGTFRYSIKYIDAYGYSHEISCNLNKQDIAYTTTGMDFININQVDYTKDPIKIGFDSACKATYSLNGSEEISYLPNEVLYKDGKYTFSIKDNSGNARTIIFTKDSSARFRVSSINGEVLAYNGGVINANSLIFDPLEDTSFIKYLKYNGQLIDPNLNTSFSKTGHYELIIEDSVANTAYFHFYLVNHSLCEFLYTVPGSYEIAEVYRTYNDSRTPYMGSEAVDASKKQLNLSEVGKYDIILKNVYQDSTTNFTLEINKDVPLAKLVGCDEGDITTADISLSNVGLDDIVEVYKNGELVARYDDSSDESFRTITEGGEYEIKVTNIQGVCKTLKFTKKNIANTALSILVIVLCILAAGGFFVGLLFRNRSKFDE